MQRLCLGLCLSLRFRWLLRIIIQIESYSCGCEKSLLDFVNFERWAKNGRGWAKLMFSDFHNSFYDQIEARIQIAKKAACTIQTAFLAESQFRFSFFKFFSFLIAIIRRFYGCLINTVDKICYALS
jgi:hypothetical protein